MKQLAILGLSIIIALGSLSCKAQDNQKADNKTTVSDKVEVFYFHFTRRCNTCVSVEENSKLAVEQLYADKVKTGVYSFKSINLDDASSKEIAEKLGIGGQTLLVVCGNKKIDITDKGFLNAHDLAKMKEEIKKAVDNVIIN